MMTAYWQTSPTCDVRLTWAAACPVVTCKSTTPNLNAFISSLQITNSCPSKSTIQKRFIMEDPKGRNSSKLPFRKHQSGARAGAEKLSSAELDVSREIWNDAYDRLKREQAPLVDIYERVLSSQLMDCENIPNGLSSSGPGAPSILHIC